MVPSIRTIKTFTYRGAPQQFSNRFYFNGGTPADATAWHAFMDAVTNLEKIVYPAHVSVIRAVGFAAGSDLPVATKDYTIPGTLGVVGNPTPGDCAAVLRMGTNKRSKKNHAVYCFSYFHGCEYTTSTTNADTLHPTQVTNVQTYGNGWLTGITAGGVTAIRATPDGHPVVGALVEPFISHRDFPR